MRFLLKNYIYSICLFAALYGTPVFSQTDPSMQKDSHSLRVDFNQAVRLKHEYPDSAMQLLQELLPEFIRKEDTAGIITNRFELLDLYSGKGDYSKAYDEIWEIMPLVETTKYAEEKINVLFNLISLYLVYDQHERAIAVYEQIPELINKSIFDSQKKNRIWGRYYSRGAWIELKSTKDYENAEKLCLKSIGYFIKVDNNLAALHHTETLLANIYILMGKAEKASKILFNQNKYYPLPLKANHALLYERLGEYYELVQNRDSAIYYYTRSLEAIDKFNKLMDKKPLMLKNLAAIYSEKGNYRKAFQLQKKASHFNDLLFSSQESQNKQLFEIKDKYQEQIKEQEERIQKQQLNLLSKENKLIQLRAFSIGLSLLALAFLIIYSIRRKAKKAILQQSLINQEQKLEIQKQQEILEVKNKELLGSALQLLERENEHAAIKKSLNTLKLEGENAAIVKQLRNDLKIDKTQKWEEFEKRFTAVNDQFLQSLKEQYPRLSPTDLKMCAFIKLGFSSKDMAQIMGITVEGINTSRSRLRKKMDLPREIVLTEFLQGFNC